MAKWFSKFVFLCLFFTSLWNGLFSTFNFLCFAQICFLNVYIKEWWISQRHYDVLHLFSVIQIINTTFIYIMSYFGMDTDFNLCAIIYIYIYIYTHTHIQYMYIYIYAVNAHLHNPCVHVIPLEWLSFFGSCNLSMWHLDNITKRQIVLWSIIFRLQL